MRTIKCKLGTGFTGADYVDEIEVEDNLTDDEITEAAWDYMT